MEYRKENTQFFKPKKDFGPRRNEYIRVPEVLVIDQEGNNLGALKTYDALKLARDAGLDLVEVSPNVTPPVCRIIDFAKYIYEQKKKERKSRVVTKLLKEFEFSPVIDIGDKQTRIRRAKEFLNDGHQVRLIMLKKAKKKKGRKSQFLPQLASEVFADILTNFTDYNSIEPEPKMESGKILLTFKPNGKTKNK